MRKARAALGLIGDLRWVSPLEALPDCAGVSPQVVTRYSSATIQAGDVAVVAVERRQRWRGIAARMEDRR